MLDLDIAEFFSVQPWYYLTMTLWCCASDALYVYVCIYELQFIAVEEELEMHLIKNTQQMEFAS